MQQALFETASLPLPRPARAAPPDAGDVQQRWWRLQGRARRAGRAVEPLLVTPRFLARIDAPCCPVTRAPIGRQSAHVVPLRGDADVAAGHLATLGAAAAAAAAQGSWARAWATAQRLALQPGATEAGLDAAQWRRLAVLRSFVQPLTPAHAASLPLAVLPPNRLRVASAVQGLQVAITLALAAPQRARHLCRLAMLAADADTRQALRVFVLTLLARCPADLAARAPLAQRHALEDLAADPLLARRWQRLALHLSDDAAMRLLEQARGQGLLGRGWRPIDAGTAVDGWALPPAKPALRPLQSAHASDRPAGPLPVPPAPGLARAVLGAGRRRQRADAGATAAVGA